MNNKKLLIRIRWFTISLAAGVVFLAAEFLLTNDKRLEGAAITMAIGGLILISVLVNRAIHE